MLMKLLNTRYLHLKSWIMKMNVMNELNGDVNVDFDTGDWILMLIELHLIQKKWMNFELERDDCVDGEMIELAVYIVLCDQ